MDTRHVVTAFLTRGGRVLLLRRSREVSAFPDLWGGVSGDVERAPPEQVLMRVRQETGFEGEEIELLRIGEPLALPDPGGDRTWVVHPFLFALVTDRDPVLDREHVEAEWVDPGRLADRETVSCLEEALDRVWPAAQRRDPA